MVSDKTAPPVVPAALERDLRELRSHRERLRSAREPPLHSTAARNGSQSASPDARRLTLVPATATAEKHPRHKRPPWARMEAASCPGFPSHLR